MRGQSALAGVLLGAALLLPAITHAQTTIPETPPELRDFRLDKPAESRRETTQPVAPPPAVPTTEQRNTTPRTATPRTTAPRTTPKAEQPAPRRDAPASATQRIETPAQAPTSQQVAPETATEIQPTVESETPAVTTETPTETAPVVEAAPAQDSSPFPMWALWAALGVAALAAAAFIFRRRKPKEVADYEPVAYQPVVEPEATKPELVVEPAPIPAKVEPAPQSVASARPRLAITFAPDKAVVSLANLTVSGKLRVVNQGDVPAEGLKLRVGLTSARQNQAEIISAFHADAPNFPAQALGNANPGEQLELPVDLQVPLSELQSFPVGNQRLFVPVMFANVAYGWDGAEDVDVAEIACLIGREATPPQPKMGPLRLDLGPRSFNGLGQRPLAA